MAVRLPDWLARRAASDGQRLAVVAGDLRWSFAELDRRASAVARRLVALGVRPGDRVALLLPNAPEWAELLFGVGRAGGVLVPLNVRLAPAELAWQIGQVAPRLVIHAPATEGLARSALEAAPGAGTFGCSVEELAAVPEVPGAGGPRPVDLDEPHTILFTSGTTGRPKAVVLTYGNLWWSAVGSALNLGIHQGDRWLANLPLFHVGGLSILVRSVIYGTTAVVHERFDPEAANRAVDEERVTLLSLVATTLARMLEARGARRFPPSLRAALVGGGPTPPALLERALRLGLPVAPTYGLTEAASQVTTLPPWEAARKVGSSGRALLPTEVRIDRDGQPAAPGEVGEILVRGPTVSPGWLAGPEGPLVSLVDEDGWLRTGDLGHLDEEGHLYVVDRRDDLIVSGGENVYPAEVEAALMSHPAVEEAAVVGVPDPVWGQVAVAVVRLKPGQAVSPEALVAHCEARLARYKRPRAVRIVEEPLPRNAAGKLQRHRLRERWDALRTAD
ncbi:MAG TPA: o-succinylbenzoate--CoA ligase [Thermaerobacter sp.]